MPELSGMKRIGVISAFVFVFHRSATSSHGGPGVTGCVGRFSVIGTRGGHWISPHGSWKGQEPKPRRLGPAPLLVRLFVDNALCQLIASIHESSNDCSGVVVPVDGDPVGFRLVPSGLQPGLPNTWDILADLVSHITKLSLAVTQRYYWLLVARTYCFNSSARLCGHCGLFAGRGNPSKYHGLLVTHC